MKKTSLMLMAAAVLSVSCAKEWTPASEQQPMQSKLVGMATGARAEGELLIKLSGDAVKGMNDGTLDTGHILKGIEGASMTPLFPEDNDPIAAKYGLHKWYKLSFCNSTSTERVAEIIHEYPEIEAIEYNSILEVPYSESFRYVETGTATKSADSAPLPFNDRALAMQWNLINDGTACEGAAAGADIGVKDAWRLTAGDPRVIVAVLDLGVAIEHDDLKNAMWKNAAEINGKDGVDDDRNGYVDDKYGYNFAEGKGELTYSSSAYHGTHVAGTIAATNNNGYGVSSVAGGSGKGDGVRIMSCQIASTDGSIRSENAALAFHYAAKNGASIAQCSYGYEREDMETVEYEALQYFLDPANANCPALETNMVIYSAGNFNNPASLYPGAVHECISVTAFCPDFLPGGYTNYGAGCDIAAPGGDVVEDNPQAHMILSTGIENDQMSFVYTYGTSMACPHVSGVVALGMSYALKIGKRFSAEDFKSRLLSSAKDIDGYISDGMTKFIYQRNTGYMPVDISCKKGKMGAGGVDAWNFLMALEGTPLFMTVPGQPLIIDLEECIGNSYDKYRLLVEDETADALGLSSDPVIIDGKIEITCTRTGAGKIALVTSVGKGDDSNEISELEYQTEISIVSRPAVAKNGGWL